MAYKPSIKHYCDHSINNIIWCIGLVSNIIVTYGK